MNFKKVLIICAHPDDEVLGCGGFISKFVNKINIKVLVIAEGSSCRFEANSNFNRVEQEIQKRNKYFKNAMKYLKINKYNLNNFKCGRLDEYSIIDISKIIEKEINFFKPDTIFTHSNFDVNNDHRIVNQATIQATRPNALNYIPNILSFEVLSSTEWNYNYSFNPNYFINLSTKDINKKINALKYYKTEINKYPHPRSTEGIRALSMYRGIQSGFKFAEAFQIIRVFKS